MANYLTAVIPRDLEGAFRAWIEPHLPGSGSPEHLVLDLPGTSARLHHVARNATRDAVGFPRATAAPAGPATPAGPAETGAVFHGYAHSAEQATTVFGAPGLSAAIVGGRGELFDTPAGGEWEGSYALVSWRGGELQAHTDFFRLVPMLVTAGRGLLAVSDSWQLLVRLRTALGLPITMTGDVAAAQTLNRVIGGHPLDTRTLCSEVDVVGVGARLSARLGPEGVREHEVRQVPFHTVFAGRQGTWAEQVRFGAISMASILRSHVESGLQLRLSLSGGADSRAVLAALRRADPRQRVTTMNTTNRGPANVRDAAVVDQLAESLGLTLGERPANPVRVERYPTPFQAWMVGSLGLHDRLGMPKSRALPGSHYTLTGHGAGTYKSTYGWRSFREVALGLEQFDPDAGPLAAKHAEGYLRSVGVDPQAGGSSEWHFIAWRNSLHGGRSTLINLLSVPPLMQRGLTSLAHADPDSPTAMPEGLRRTREDNAPRSNTSLTQVMMALLDPELARLPFDDKAKDIDAQTLQDILAAAGGPVAEGELVAVRAYGAPADVESGIAATFLSLAESWGQGVALKHDAIRPLVEEGSRIAGDLGLGDWYGPVAERARKNLDDPGTLTQKDGSIAKVLALLPLASATVVGPVPARSPTVTRPPAGERAAGKPGTNRPAVPGSSSVERPPVGKAPAAGSLTAMARRVAGTVLPSGVKKWIRRRLGA